MSERNFVRRMMPRVLGLMVFGWVLEVLGELAGFTGGQAAVAFTFSVIALAGVTTLMEGATE